MSEIPTIFVTDGWGTAKYGKLTDIVIPSSVKTLNAPSKVTFMGTHLSVVPSSAEALLEFEAPNLTAISTYLFQGYTNLISVSFNNLTSITTGSVVSSGTFRGCTSLQSVNMPKLNSVSYAGFGEAGIFALCTSLQTVNFPSLDAISITTGWNGMFYGCTALKTVNLPLLQRIAESSPTGGSDGVFGNCTALESVTLGSVGHPVTALTGNYIFKNCTQSGLTITIYTQGGASLAGEPWGATNAAIVYEEA